MHIQFTNTRELEKALSEEEIHTDRVGEMERKKHAIMHETCSFVLVVGERSYSGIFRIRLSV